jgi:hypothetical protein
MVSVVNDLFAQAYLQEAFGYDCVDSGTVPGALGRDPDLYFIRRLGFGVMPINKTVQGMDPDQLFDFLEALHDVVSMGNELTGYYHEFSRCGWHFRDFDRRYGQDHLETVVNPLMARLETPLVLTPEGQLEELTAPDMQSLLDTPLTDVVRLTDRQRVDAAVNRFKRSRGNPAERRAAVQELAAVLEFLRPSGRLDFHGKKLVTCPLEAGSPPAGERRIAVAPRPCLWCRLDRPSQACQPREARQV